MYLYSTTTLDQLMTLSLRLRRGDPLASLWCYDAEHNCQRLKVETVLLLVSERPS